MDIKIVLVLILIVSVIEILICKFFRKTIVKFILPIVLLVISLFSFSVGEFAPLEGMQDLAYIVTGMLAGISSLISFVVAIVYVLLFKGVDKR